MARSCSGGSWPGGILTNGMCTSPKFLAGAPVLFHPRLGDPLGHRVFTAPALMDQVVSSASLAHVRKALARLVGPDLSATATGEADGFRLSPHVPARLRSGAQVGRRRREACRPYQPALTLCPPSLPSSFTCCPSLGPTHTVYSLSQRCQAPIDRPSCQENYGPSQHPKPTHETADAARIPPNGTIARNPSPLHSTETNGCGETGRAQL